MKYFRCVEITLADDNFLHYYDEANAHGFVQDFFVDGDGSYPEDYEKEYGATPEADYERMSPIPTSLDRFIIRCFDIYGYDAEIQHLNREPHHKYRWNNEHGAWLIENPDKE